MTAKRIPASDLANRLAAVMRAMDDQATLYAELTGDRRADLKAQEDGAAKRKGLEAVRAVYLTGYDQGLIDAQEQATRDLEELLLAITPPDERHELEERNARRRELENPGGEADKTAPPAAGATSKREKATERKRKEAGR